MDMLLLFRDWLMRLATRPPESAATMARLLSSYNNNSNNPRRGTDPLRGAW
nr:hypothetical protein [Mycolicibacterium obuense]